MNSRILAAIASLAWLAVNTTPLDAQSVDAFDPGVGASGFNPTVYCVTLQLDGKVLVGGDFTQLAGETHYRLGRVNSDGSPDKEFTTASTNSYPTVHTMAIEPDQKILVAGKFTNLNGVIRKRIARLNLDGSVDGNFNPGASYRVDAGSQLDGLLVQPDGKILVLGTFTTLGGLARTNLGRLNNDGSVDTGFALTGITSPRALALQTDGSILVGGYFNSVAGFARTNFVRLDPNGNVDVSFDAGPGMNGNIYSFAVQADGKIVVGGQFTSLGGVARAAIGRLNPDGSVDADFNPGASEWAHIMSLALQADGKIIAAGKFKSLAGIACTNIGRLNPDGSFDSTFNPGADASEEVDALAIQPDGKILACGGFTTLAGQLRSRLARLENPDFGHQGLNLSSGGGVSTITWTRTGDVPEIWAALFEYSTNGNDWMSLGVPARISGGWQWSGDAISIHTSVRARGFVPGGGNKIYSWLTEYFLGSPGVTTQPVSRTNNAGTTATFTVLAGGSEIPVYQWLKNGTNLVDSLLVTGAQTATLTLNGVLGRDAGSYCVVLTNSLGSVTSHVATLTVIDPFISVPPTNQLVNAGSPVTFSLSTIATAPRYFQWRKDGTNLGGAISASLTLTNVQWADRGNYDVIVSNAFGCATSAVAVLSVNLALADSFAPQVYGAPYAIAPQLDGGILVGGTFGSVNSETRRTLAWFNADGSLKSNVVDAVFDYMVTPEVRALALDTDGSFLAGGLFWTFGNPGHTNAWRLFDDGSVDTNFNAYAPYYVNCLARQTDGKILVGGHFDSINGMNQKYLARLNANGTLDTNFAPVLNGYVWNVVQQPDGKILISGGFTTIGGATHRGIGRIETNGAVDASFTPNTLGSLAYVHALVLQPDGKILVGGSFTNLANQTRMYLARLNANGTLDSSFNPTANDWVRALALQADGRILVAGYFTTISDQPRQRIARLNPDGSLDDTFNPGADNIIQSLAIQPDGCVLAGGIFSQLGAVPRRNLGRVINPDAATQSLSSDGSTITWLRGGSTPEIWRAMFEYSSNGTDWLALGNGTRIPGGWQLTGLSLPSGVSIRARGFVPGAGKAGYIVENSTVGAPTLSIAFNSQLSTITISWSLSAGDWVLERTLSLAGNPPPWIDLAPPYETNGNVIFFTFTNAPAAERQFFRLHAP